MVWLKKNWFLFVLVVIILVAVSGWFGSCNDDKKYEKKIQELDNEIEGLEKEKKEAEKRAQDAIKEAKKFEEKALEKEKEISKLNEQLLASEEKYKKIETKISKLTPNEVVKETINIIKTEEVELRNLGVVFSIGASRKNLGFLQKFTLCKDENSILTDKVDKYEGEIGFLKISIKNLKEANKELNVAKEKCEGITTDLRNKYNLCEGNRKKKWLKGFLNGALVGGGAIALLAILAK